MQDSQQNLRGSSSSQTGSLLKAYLDTTVVANALLRADSTGRKSTEAIRRCARSEMPVYAIKEFKVGPLRGWVWCHNKFNETRSFADTLSAINAISATPSRNFSSSARQALEQAVGSDKAAFTQTLELQGEHGEAQLDRVLADRYRYYLKRRILQAWERRRMLATTVSMPLKCFEEGPIRESSDGELHFDRWSCADASDCSLVDELARHRDQVGCLMETVKDQPQKVENQKRYQALRHVLRTPTRPFTDSMCRSIGDAAFVIMAPADYVILTTNTKDFEPLAKALNKTVAEP